MRSVLPFLVGLLVTVGVTVTGHEIRLGAGSGYEPPAWPILALVAFVGAGAVVGAALPNASGPALLVGHLVAVAGVLVMAVVTFAFTGRLASFLRADAFGIGLFLALMVSLASLAVGHVAGKVARSRVLPGFSSRPGPGPAPGRGGRAGIPRALLRGAIPIGVTAAAISAGAALSGVAIPIDAAVVRVVVSDDGVSVDPPVVTTTKPRVIVSMRATRPLLLIEPWSGNGDALDRLLPPDETEIQRALSGAVTTFQVLRPGDRDIGGSAQRARAPGRWLWVVAEAPPGAPPEGPECDVDPSSPGCGEAVTQVTVLDHAFLTIEG